MGSYAEVVEGGTERETITSKHRIRGI